MLKFLLLSSLITFVASASSNIVTVPEQIAGTAIVAEPTHIQLHEPTLAKVGDVVESVPTAVSHQSSTIVHSRAQRVTPIVAPALRSYTAPALRTYAAPLMRHQAQMLHTYVTAGLSPAAHFVHSHAPFQLRAFHAGPALAAYGYGAPFVYAAATPMLH